MPKISGPVRDDYDGYTTLGGFPNVCVASRHRVWYRQYTGGSVNRPSDLIPLPYKASTVISNGNGSWADVRNSVCESYLSPTGLLGHYHGTASNKALSRFKAAMNTGEAGWLMNIVGFSQSLEMISRRAKQLARAFNAIRRGNLATFLNVLELDVLQKHAYSVRRVSGNGRFGPRRRAWRYERVVRLKPNVAANALLEYQFGWMPLCRDIQSSIEILQSPPPPIIARGRGSASCVEHRYIDDAFPDMLVIGRVRCLIQATVRVTNPNLYLANQLGLINLPATLWDAIPFSFLLDWILPVSKFLNSMSDFLGLELTNSFTSRSYIASDQGKSVYLWNGKPRIRGTACRVMERVMGIPSVSFLPKGLTALGAFQARTSVALLTQAIYNGKLDKLFRLLK